MNRMREIIAALLALVLVAQPLALPVRAGETDETTQSVEAAMETVQETEPTVPETEHTCPETEPETEPQTEPTQAEQETTPPETAATEPPKETTPPPKPEESRPTEPVEQTEPPEQTEPEKPREPADVPLYLQTDYPQAPYGNSTVGKSGSGITCLAMAATYMTEHKYTPDRLASYFGAYCDNESERLEYASDALRLPWYSTENWAGTVEALEAGGIVIVRLNNKSILTDSSQFVVLTGLKEDGRVVVNDPYGPHHSRADLKPYFRDGFPQEQIRVGFESGWCYDISVMPDEPYIYEAQPLERGMDVPLYNQMDYPDVRYGDGMISTSGCGIVSLAMVASYMTGHEYLPDTLADYFGGYTGNNVQRFEHAADVLQLPWSKPLNWHVVLKALREGKLAVVLVDGRSEFTTSQHFLVLKGITKDGKVLVNDAYGPNYENSKLQAGFEEGFPQAMICAGYCGAWVFDVDAMPEHPFIYEEAPKPYVDPRYPELNLTAADMDLLARMVWVEARGEVFDGQQAVAEVVLNRVVSGQFGSTVREVIYAENQFRSTAFLDDAKPTQTQYEAVEQALYGPYVLPMGVMHFARYAVNKNVWGSIGGHVFCYQWESSEENGEAAEAEEEPKVTRPQTDNVSEF